MKYLFLFFVPIFIVSLNSCQKSAGDTSLAALPTLTTSPLDSISAYTAISGGNITNDGGSQITLKGIVWDTSSNPTVALSTKTIDESGSATFVSHIKGLKEKTTYYIRSYATNSTGTGYGNELSFITLAATVKIGDQVWMLANLNVPVYRDGTPIPQVKDSLAWSNLTTGAWCWYNNDSATYAATYGRLYNWYAVNDPRGLAPIGWHIPSDAELIALGTYLGGDQIAGGAMKESGTTHWLTPNTGATNSSGFTALPGGHRDPEGYFRNLGTYGSCWSSNSFDANTANFQYLSYNTNSILRFHYNKKYGLPVRYLKDR